MLFLQRSHLCGEATPSRYDGSVIAIIGSYSDAPESNWRGNRGIRSTKTRSVMASEIMIVTIKIKEDSVEFSVPDELMKIPNGYMGNQTPELKTLWELYFLPAVAALIRE